MAEISGTIDASNYGEGEVGGSVHITAQGVMIDDAEPYPPNKPYYDAAFRRRIDGAPPTVTRNADGITLAHNGFRRIKSVGEITRNWRFDYRPQCPGLSWYC